ncbi:MAG: hypothetical protein HC902_07590 [Calothrix sp. SM1_5_4]|nr:hypothetical protein [Calothrix sp. SM1_5_4]
MEKPRKYLKAAELKEHLEAARKWIRFQPAVVKDFIGPWIARLVLHLNALVEKIYELEREVHEYRQQDMFAREAERKIRVEQPEVKIPAEYVSPEERERIRNEVRQKSVPPPDARLPKETP